MLPVLDLGFFDKCCSSLVKIRLICPSITNNIRKGGIRKPKNLEPKRFGQPGDVLGLKLKKNWTMI